MLSMQGLFQRICLTLIVVVSAESDPDWPTCDSRAYRDEEIDPGGLRLLGVKESPLGDFPLTPAALTHEHFFQQLREVWTDDCPRIMVQVGLQPALGKHQNWTAASLWLRYFNHSGIVLAVDAISDYLDHFEQSLRASPAGQLFSQAGGSLQLLTAKVVIDAEGKAKAKERPVSFDSLDGRKVLAVDEVMRACADTVVGSEANDFDHPCSIIRKRMAQPKPLQYSAPIVSFDDLWKQQELLKSRHIDFLHVDIGAFSMAEIIRKGFAGIFMAREVSVFSFRVDRFWTKAELGNMVEFLDSHEYFSLFKFACSNSSQVGKFSYIGPAGENGLITGPTTYLPVSGIDFKTVIDWDRMPLPQDVLALDLRQPDLFRTVQLGDAQCDADDLSGEGTCASDSKDGECKSGVDTQPPERPQQLRVFRSESRSLTIEWRPYPDGPKADTYALRVDPGAMEDALEHNMFDMATGVQTHTISGLKPSTEYTIKLQAVNSVGASGPATVTHRTEREEMPPADSMYNVVESLHCGMSTSEEVQPPGPPPGGGSFFRDVTEQVGCQARCDENRQCVAFQVKVGDACWLYRRRPREGRLSGPRMDLGWWCGVRQTDV